MNAIMSTTSPLSATLDQPSAPGTGQDQTAQPSEQERMQLIEAAIQMIIDPSWEAANDANDALDAALTVVNAAPGRQGLVSNAAPMAAATDVIRADEAVWPRLSNVVEDYLDFRRLRRMEAQLRGCGETEFSFKRADWEQARRGEVALVAHQRQVREHSYLQSAAPLFLIH